MSMSTASRSLLAMFFLLPLLLPTGCGSAFFYPSRDLGNNPFIGQFDHQDVYFPTRDGLTLHGWFFRAKEPAGSILAMHGNAQNISTHVNGLLWLVANGFNVFIFDYRGYGRSEGAPSLSGIQIDAEAAFDRLLTLPSVDPDRIILFGQSLGGTVAVNLASAGPAKERIKALVIDSAFASHRVIAREKIAQLCIWPIPGILSPFFGSSYSPVKRIAGVSPVPVLILHGLRDTVVPAIHGERLFGAAREPKELWLTTEAGHIRSTADPEVRALLKGWLLQRLAQNQAGERAIKCSAAGCAD